MEPKNLKLIQKKIKNGDKSSVVTSQLEDIAEKEIGEISFEAGLELTKIFLSSNREIDGIRVGKWVANNSILHNLEAFKLIFNYALSRGNQTLIKEMYELAKLKNKDEYLQVLDQMSSNFKKVSLAEQNQGQAWLQCPKCGGRDWYLGSVAVGRGGVLMDNPNGADPLFIQEFSRDLPICKKCPNEILMEKILTGKLAEEERKSNAIATFIWIAAIVVAAVWYFLI